MRRRSAHTRFAFRANFVPPKPITAHPPAPTFARRPPCAFQSGLEPESTRASPPDRPRMSQEDDRVRLARPGSEHRDPSGSKGQSGSSNRHNRLGRLPPVLHVLQMLAGRSEPRASDALSPEPASPRTYVCTCVPQRHRASRPTTPWAPCVPSPPMVGQRPFHIIVHLK